MARKIVAGLVAGVVVMACRDGSPAGIDLVQPNVDAVLPAPAGKYIVVYKSSVSDARTEIKNNVSTQDARVERVYEHAFQGWAGDLSASELGRLRADPHVAFIEADQVVHATGVQSPTPSWGLDRIDQISRPLSSSYGYNRTGAGVHFYGIDTGILYTHNDLGGRAIPGFDAVAPSTGAVDCSGHGTHTASTAAGNQYGVAKGMTIVGVRVLDCFKTGTTSQIIAGVDWVTQHAIKPAVANMSIEVPLSAALNQAITNSIATGIVYVVAAGNSSANACGVSPAATANAITVGAIDSVDARASFSDFGSCVDIFAPGVKIVAATVGSSSATQAASGTSMATAHVSGIVGLYLEANPTATPAQVAAALLANASANKISNPGTGSPNKLVYMGFIAGANKAPTATIMLPGAGASFAQGATVSFSGSGSDPEQGALSGTALVWTSSRDGQIGTGTVFSRTSLSVGTHTITLTAKDAQGATAIATRSITITTVAGNQAPTAGFTVTCPALQCSFNGASSSDDVGVVSYAWSWGNGRSETHSQSTATQTYQAPGTYSVTLKVTDGGGLSGSIIKSVQVPTPTNQAPTAGFTFGCNTGIPHQCVFDASASSDDVGIITYTWNWGNGTIETKTRLTTKNTWPGTGTYNVTLTVTDGGGRTSSVTKLIVVP